jgi:hypothetical protein
MLELFNFVRVDICWNCLICVDILVLIPIPETSSSLFTWVDMQACFKLARTSSERSTPFRIKSLRIVAASFQYL